MIAAMTITCQLTAEDYIMATRLQLSRVRPTLKLIFWLIVVPCVGLTLFFVARSIIDDHPDWMAVWLPLAIGYLVCWWLLLLPRRIRKLFRQQKALHVPLTVEITDSVFKGSSELGHFEMPLR